MATTLPPIQSPKGGRFMVGKVEEKPEEASSHAAYLIAAKKARGKRERDVAFRRVDLRRELPDLTSIEASRYQNSYKHNLFVTMLKDGFHRSYTEVFTLIKDQNERRLQAGPESLLWTQVLLQDEHEKLDKLKEHLCQAETAERLGNYAEVYKCQHALATFFQDKNDKVLSNHFFNRCLQSSQQVDQSLENGSLQGESHCNVALALEENGDIFESSEHFQAMYALTEQYKEWAFSDGKNMHQQACIHLCRILTKIAKKYTTSKELKKCLSHLLRAAHLANEAGEIKLIGSSNFRLGLAYQKNGEPDKALHCLKQYFDICQQLDDPQGVGEAAEAMAKAYESQGRVEEAIKYLEMFVRVAEENKDEKAVSKACSDLGAMFNSLGRYDQAVDYFNKSYNIARAANDTETISSSSKVEWWESKRDNHFSQIRVLFGVAAAHKMLDGVTKHIDVSNRVCITRMLEWKDNRADEFSKEIPVENIRMKKAENIPLATLEDQVTELYGNAFGINVKMYPSIVSLRRKQSILKNFNYQP